MFLLPDNALPTDRSSYKIIESSNLQETFSITELVSFSNFYSKYCKGDNFLQHNYRTYQS